MEVRTKRDVRRRMTMFNATTSTKTSNSDQLPVCRICLEENEPLEMICPCDCRGTQSQVHRHCVIQWFEASKSTICGVCGKSYGIKRTKLRPWYEWGPPQPISNHFEDQMDFACCGAWLLFNTHILYAIYTIGVEEMHAELCEIFASCRIAKLWWASFLFNMIYYLLRYNAIYQCWREDNSVFEWQFNLPALSARQITTSESTNSHSIDSLDFDHTDTNNSLR